MPLYVLQDTNTEEITEHLMSWSALQDFLAANPQQKLLPASPAIVSGVSGRLKTDEGFRDILRTIKSKHRGSTVDVK